MNLFFQIFMSLVVLACIQIVIMNVTFWWNAKMYPEDKLSKNMFVNENGELCIWEEEKSFS